MLWSRHATVLMLAVFPLACCGAALAADRPNVVLILADDLGYGDPGCYNDRSKVPTPNIDRLAAEGMRFTDAHSPSAVCTPTRYGLLTGRYCWRTRLKQKVLSQYAMPLVEPGRVTLGSMLQEHGYVTACIGKWHLGMQWGRKDGGKSPPTVNFLPEATIDLSRPIAAGPLTAGFDSYFGIDIAAQPPYCFIENDRLVPPLPDRPKPASMYGRPGRMQQGWRFDNILPTLTARSVQFIRDHVSRDPDRPFLLYIPLNAPHVPIAPSAPFVGRTEATAYGDFVCEVDAHVGAVLETLDELGIRENTLVVFTSDNGSPARNGENTAGPLGSVTRDSGHRPNGRWRGIKADIYEGGHRVPFLARWPSKIRENSVSDALICHVDLLATMAAVVGHELPEGAGEDSRNMLPVLLGQERNGLIRQSVVLHSWDGMFAIRQGDWKLIEGLGSGGFSQPRRVKPTPGGPQGQLYNLADDPGERNNLYQSQPDVVARLSDLLAKLRAEGAGTTGTPGRRR